MIIKKLTVLVLVFFFLSEAHSESYITEDIKFDSHNDTLSGTIVLPKDKPIHSAVVFVHGSGEQTRNIYWAEQFASQGIAALVYDKRGVGDSGGIYEGNQSVSEKNINLLADDSIAALNQLHKHSRIKNVPLGLTGISQAGWIVPVAAANTNIVNFIALWSAPVCKVSEEDIFSKYTADLDATAIPTFQEALDARKTKYIWPDFLGIDMDSSEVLSKLEIPGFWVFGENDGSVPVDLSIQKLKALKNVGHSYDYALFSNLGHNNMQETFTTVTDWIKRLPN